jgi:hypothetical protein
MRSLLVWIGFRLIPESSGFIRRPSEWEKRVDKSMIWTIITLPIYICWLILLLYLSALWRDRLDPSFAAFAQFSEEVMLGKRALWSQNNDIRFNVGQWLYRSLGQGDKDGEMSELKAKHDVEQDAEAEIVRLATNPYYGFDLLNKS